MGRFVRKFVCVCVCVVGVIVCVSGFLELFLYLHLRADQVSLSGRHFKTSNSHSCRHRTLSPHFPQPHNSFSLRA